VAEIADRRTDGFSHGQKLKVAVARALVHEPRNVILDEPTNGLDVMGIRAMRFVLRRLREEGKCVLFSSHIMHEVSTLCDRVVVIARGRVVAEGSPAELRRETQKEDLEDVFIEFVERHHLPAPARQVNPDGLLADDERVDFAWPAAKLVVETDGGAFHDSPSDRARDERRDRALEHRGWTVLRFGWNDLRHRPTSVRAILRRALRLEG